MRAIPEFSLEHPIGLNISRRLTRSLLVNFPQVKHQDMRTGYHWYTFPGTNIFGATVIVGLSFYDLRLESVSFALWKPEWYGRDWGDWSEEKERLCSKHTEEWLQMICYPIGKYDWGEVWAGYDPRSGSGGAGLRYFPIIPANVSC